MPFVIFYGIRFFSFLAFSVKCDFTGLSLIRKAAFLTWWVGLGLPLLLAPLLLIWIGLLYLKYQWHGKPRGLDSSVFKETCAVHVLPILLLSRFVAKDISPVITWVLMICSRSQGQPYHQSERIFILSSATYYSWVIPTFIFYSAWGYSCRRLWLAFHAVNPMLFSLSIWNLAAWKITFTEGNCLTNLLILLRIYRLWQFLDYSWVVSWFDSWFPEEL